ncbi:T-cell surface glycoprotein CD8 alpha chain isoform 2-T2 [Synchiropus picturatus]
MAHHFIPLLVILASQICPSVRASEPVILSPKEGEQVQIQCKPSIGSLVMWFRVLDGGTVEFIGSFSSNGVLKGTLPSIFTHTPGKEAITLNSFKSSRDSGLYTCGSLKNNQVNFGQVTSLIGEKIVNRPPPTIPSKINPATTKARPCTCPTLPKQGENAPLSAEAFTETHYLLLQLQWKPAAEPFVSRSSWAGWPEAAAFFFCSLSSSSCTAITPGHADAHIITGKGRR